MKKFAYTIVMLLSFFRVDAITVDRLLNNLRKHPDIQYEVFRGKHLKTLLDSNNTYSGKETFRSAKNW